LVIVDAAALPGAAEHLGDRLLQTGVRAVDDHLNAGQAALDERLLARAQVRGQYW